MTRVGRHIAALTLACAGLAGSAAMATGEDAPDALTKWVDDAAALFSHLCMGGAPTFAQMEQRALNAGFQNVDGRLIYLPAATLSLKDTGETCVCQMAMGAPEPARLIIAVLERLEADFDGASRPYEDLNAKHDYAAYYMRDETEVLAELTFHDFKGQALLVGFVTARGRCGA